MIRQIFFTAIAAMLLFGGVALASESGMPLLGKAFPPPAFKAFCAQQARLCATSGRAKTVILTSRRRSELDQVNRSVNRRIQERSDLETTGRDDSWGIPSSAGDCEDFAILKKKELLAKGWPASVLLLTVGRAGPEGHTVLTVRTDAGDLILDNRTNRIKDWKRTPYRYFARQAQGAGRQWERIGVR